LARLDSLPCLATNGGTACHPARSGRRRHSGWRRLPAQRSPWPPPSPRRSGLVPRYIIGERGW
jgi:hypothetical protein